MIDKTCVQCGKAFRVPPSRKEARCCSNACSGAFRTGLNSSTWNGGLTELACLVCGKPIFVKPSHIKNGKGKTCSLRCRGIRQSKTQKGKSTNRVTKHCVICGTAIEVKASHKDTEGTYCSQACMAQGYQSKLRGDANPNWKGGSVMNTCKQCGTSFEADQSHLDREFCSRSCSATWRMLNENIKSRSKGGRREDLNNTYFRSAWEANYARYLNWLISIGEIKQWEFEAETFIFEGIKRGNRTYLPDFKVINRDGSLEYHEVKGYMDSESATKLRRMAKYYPHIKLILIDAPVYKGIERQMSNALANWEFPQRRRRKPLFEEIKPA